MNKARIVLAKVLFLLAAAAIGTSALAQSYPSRAIRVIIGFGPGGVTDVIVRMAADEMSKRLAQPVVVENRPGAGGLVAALAVKSAPPDGYTLYGGNMAIVSPIFIKDNAIVASKEFAPVSNVATSPFFVYVRADLGIRSLAELAGYAKANPGKLKFATAAGTSTALAAVLAQRLGFEFQRIPYKTTDQMIVALLNGESDFLITGLTGFTPHLQSGKLRAVATLGSSRNPLAPSIPTAVEQGVAMDIAGSTGVWAPLGTPREPIERLNQVINEALKSPEVVERISKLLQVAVGSTPDGLVKQFELETRFYAEAMSLAGLKPE